VSTTVSAPAHTLPLTHNLDRFKTDPAYQSFALLRIGFTVAPILFGADKFANILVNWEKYLAPWIRHLSPLSATHTMHLVGVIEIWPAWQSRSSHATARTSSPRGSAGSSSPCSATPATTTSHYATSD
jgi:hypothetical protein